MLKKFIIASLMIVSSSYSFADDNLFSAPLRSENIFNSVQNIKETQSILNAQEAFRPTIVKENNNLSVNFDIQHGYYIYKDKFHLKVNGIEINSEDIQFPKNQIEKNDSVYGKTLVYQYNAIFKTKIMNSKDYNVSLTYQGCSETYNICYPIETVNKNFITEIRNLEEPNKIDEIKKEQDYLSENDIDTIHNNIINKSIISTSLTFFAIGLLLCFSPCVFPTLPLISSIVIGNNKKPLLVSSIYGLGFITSYAFIGLIVDLFSTNLQLIIQKPIFIYISAFIFMILGILTLSKESAFTFNKFNNSINNKISSITNKSLLSTFCIGFMSSLILSPCAVAPLGATILFITQENKLFYGMFLLAILALGMILPLIIMATTLKKIIPKSGKWLIEFRKILGFILIGFSVYSLSRFMNEQTLMLSLIFLTTSLIIILESKVIKIVVLSIFLLGINIYKPDILNQNSYKTQIKSLDSYAVKINSLQELNNIKNEAEKNNKELIVYIGADWCVSCKEMKEKGFKDNSVIEKYLNSKKIIAYLDISNINKDNKEVLSSFGLEIAPYFVIYKYDKNKKLIIDSISVGYMDSSKIKKIL